MVTMCAPGTRESGRCVLTTAAAVMATATTTNSCVENFFTSHLALASIVFRNTSLTGLYRYERAAPIAVRGHVITLSGKRPPAQDFLSRPGLAGSLRRAPSG